jgi:hypothetical protein
MPEEATMFQAMKSKVAAAALVIAAISAPAASARPIDLVPPAARDTTTSRVVQTQPARTIEVASNDFDWSDAAIGAGGMLTLLGLGTGAVLIARRRGGPLATS